MRDRIHKTLLSGKPAAIHMVGSGGNVLSEDILWAPMNSPNALPRVMWLGYEVDLQNFIRDVVVVDAVHGQRVKVQLDEFYPILQAFWNHQDQVTSNEVSAHSHTLPSCV